MASQEPPETETARRLQALLNYYGQLFPTAWRDAENFRLIRADLGDWPDWCWVPMAGAYATVSSHVEAASYPAPPQMMAYDTAVLSALVAWLPGKGIYRFDPTLVAELWETPVSGDLPGELLFQLPEYGVYIEAPEDIWHGTRRLMGAFAHLEWDVNQNRAELRILLDLGTPFDMVVLPIHLGGTLEDGLRNALRYTTTLNLPEDVARVVSGLTREDIDAGARWLTLLAQPVVSCLLYLCSEGAEYAGDRTPRHARADSRHGHEHWSPPALATVWDVGVRMGAALRQAREEAGNGEGGMTTGRQVRPHLRSAHWHTFLTGPRDGEQRRVLRWLPPIPVKLGTTDEHPVVSHPLSGTPD